MQTIFRLRFQRLDINHSFTEQSENHCQLNIPRRFPCMQLRNLVQQVETFYQTYRWLGNFDENVAVLLSYFLLGVKSFINEQMALFFCLACAGSVLPSKANAICSATPKHPVI